MTKKERKRIIFCKKLIASVLVFATVVTSLSLPVYAYDLSEEERRMLESAVMAEASPDFYGQALIAECALNTATLNNYTIKEVLEHYQWTKRSVAPSRSAKQAVKSVFDYGYSPSNFGLITVFYNPTLLGKPSSYHESQSFVTEWEQVRFFRENRFKEDTTLNNARRKKINEIIGELSRLSMLIEELRDDEEMAYDNLPEGIQMSERGESMENAIENLSDAGDGVNELIASLNGIIDSLEEARDGF